MFESVLVQAPQDNAALEISYETGDAVVAQSTDLAKQLKDELDKKQLAADAAGRRPAGRDAVRAGARRCLGRAKMRTKMMGSRLARPVQPAERGRSAGQADRRPADRPGVGGDIVVRRVES